MCFTQGSSVNPILRDNCNISCPFSDICVWIQILDSNNRLDSTIGASGGALAAISAKFIQSKSYTFEDLLQSCDYIAQECKSFISMQGYFEFECNYG